MAESTSNFSITFQKLKGRDNYINWKFQMKNYLRHDNLWCTIAGYPEGDGTSAGEKARRDEKALSKINLMVEQCCFSYLMTCETAKDAWEALEKAFEDKGLNRRLGLLRNLCSIRLENFQTMEAYVNEVMSISEKLRAVDKPVDDEFLGAVMLQGLTEEYQPMCMALEHSATAITSDLVKTKLLQDTKWKQGTNQVAMYSNPKYNKTSKDKYKPKKPWCYNCRIVGHHTKDCSKPKRSQEAESKGSSDKKTSDKISDKKPEKKNSEKGLFSALSVNNTIDDPGGWYIDSCCSKTMSPLKEQMSDYEQIGAGMEVTIANNGKLYSSGKGDVPVTIKNQSGNCYKTIRNVMHIPDLSVNLLSVSETVKKGYIITFDSHGCKIYDDDDYIVKGKVQMTGSEIGGIYRLDTVSNITNTTFRKPEIANVGVITASAQLWHRRLGHLNYDSLNQLKEDSAKGIKFTNDSTAVKSPCIQCLKGKHSRQPFKVNKNKQLAENKLDLIHTDLCGPMPTESWSGKRYMLTFIDDHSRKVFIYFLKYKSEVKTIVQEFVAMVETECGTKVKVIRSDNGTEYCNSTLTDFLKEKGIKHQLTVPYSPQQNGLAERYNRTIMDKVRSMLQDSDSDPKMWAEAANTAVYLINRSPTKKLSDTVPEQVWTNKNVNLKHLKVFGCEAYAHIPDEKRSKLDPKSKKYIFVGYCEDSKAYRLFDPMTYNIIKSRDVVFLEDKLRKISTDDQSEDKPQQILLLSTKEDEVESDAGSEYYTLDENDTEDYISDQDEAEEDILNQNEAISCNLNQDEAVNNQSQRRYPLRERKSKEYPDHVMYYTNCENFEPITVKEALSNNDSSEWKAAMQNEINSFQHNNVWKLVDKPTNVNIVKNKWVFKVKHDADGNIVRYRARLVAKGFTQKYGIDFTETFSPVVKHSSVRILIALAAQMNLEIDHLDVQTAFLHGDLKEKIYMSQPEGFIKPGEEDKVYLLKKAIYGLKQSSRVWNSKAKNILIKLGYKQCKNEPCVFIKRKNNNSIVIIALYVDDFFVFYNDFNEVKILKASLENNFKIKDLGPITHALGMKIERDRDKHEIKISQKQYLISVLTRFGMLECNPVRTPLEPNVKLSSAKGETNEEKLPYQQLIGTLMYLSVTTRPDISFAVSYLSQFNISHTQEHWSAAKRILRYLKGTMDLGLVYSKVENCKLVGYVDADWANDPTDRKSFTGYAFTYANAAVSWECHKQTSVALSSTEAEYMALSEAAKESVHLRAFLNEVLGQNSFVTLYDNNNCVDLYNDNQSAQKIACNPIYHRRTKHIDTRYHFVREIIDDGNIKLIYMPTTTMIADICTKSLPSPKHKYCTDGLGLSK